MRGLGGSTLRGGQTVFHGIRMWAQLFQAAMLLSAFMVVAVPAWTLWHRTTGADWYAAGMYTLAEAKLALGYDPKSGQEIRRPDGRRQVLTIRSIAASVPAWRIRERIKDEMFASAWRGAAAGLAIIALFLAWFWYRGVQLGRRRRIRGAELVTARELRRQVQPARTRLLEAMPGAGRLRSCRVAGIPYPARTETQHTIVSGTTGSGKTVLIADLVAQVRARGERCVIYDKMGSYTRAFFDPDRDVLMNPLDARAPRWSPFYEARNPRDFDMMAAALIPQQKDTVDPFWVTAATLGDNGRSQVLSLCPTLLPTLTTPMVLAVPLLMLTPTPMPVTMPMVSVLDTDRLADVRALDLGDPFGPGFPLQSPLRSDFRCNPYRLRSLALPARSACPPGGPDVPKFLTRCLASAVRSSRPRFAQRSPRHVPHPRHAPVRGSLQFPHRRCGLRPSPGCPPRPALASAPLRAPLPTPPAARCARLPSALSAVPAAQAPRRLHRASRAGVDSPFAHTADRPFRTAGAALGYTPHAAGCRACHWHLWHALSGTSAALGCLVVVGPSVCRTDIRSLSYPRRRRDTLVPHRYTPTTGPIYDRHTPVSLSIGTAVAVCPRPIYRSPYQRRLRAITNSHRKPFTGPPLSQSSPRFDTKRTVRTRIRGRLYGTFAISFTPHNRSNAVTENDPIDAENDAAQDERQGAARKPRGIRFSDSEWDEVKNAAQQHGVPAAEYVRERILDMARNPNGAGSAAIPADLVPLIERTFRYTYMLATKMRDEMIGSGRDEEIEQLIKSAREVQDSLVGTASK